ncbi:hypothetical protein [uncultured Tenacibaculum sp.]|uniref:hypothetical protein n=1 Tax=uncultured Tenacibaculum sp. TaxID=174713 RepID=UPI002622FA54|nr:hypothetical protein [uncultured Tenacibaculum sp.]
MPKNFENKFHHNKDFLDSIVNDYPDQFFDWKVTIQFYCGLHKSYTVLLTQGYSIENRHKLNIENLSKIKKSISQNIFKLYKYSRQSRYEGFITQEHMERFNKINFSSGRVILKQVESECCEFYPVTV